MPKISLSVAVYNLEDYLPKCIESILNQTFGDFELLLINDGSTDRSGKICDKYAAKDKRVKVIHQQNVGLSQVRNVALEHSTGDYIGFVDGDDWIAPTMLETLYMLCHEHDAPISMCPYLSVDEQGQPLNQPPDSKRIEMMSNKDALKRTYENKLTGYVLWNKLFKRSLFEGVNFPAKRDFQDASVLYQLLHKAKKVIYIENPLYFYLIRASGITKSQLASFSMKRLDVVPNYNETYAFMKVHHPELCDMITANFFTSLRTMLVDIMKENKVKEHREAISHICQNISAIKKRLSRNTYVDKKHIRIAKLLSRFPHLGIFLYSFKLKLRS
ncbi:glycosyltransferase [Bacillus sp. A301a_S52]|nr:glycosyltransferase [Bacillus sp. A301a_S52]